MDLKESQLKRCQDTLQLEVAGKLLDSMFRLVAGQLRFLVSACDMRKEFDMSYPTQQE